MTKYFRFWPLLAGMALAGLWVQHNAALRNEGALREQMAGLNARNAKLEDEAGRVDTAYIHDTVTFTRWKTRLDTLAVDMKVTDTVQVRQFIAVADSTVRACSVALQTCETRVALRDQRIAVLDSLLTAEKHTHPSWLSRTLGKAAWAAAGYVAGSVTHK